MGTQRITITRSLNELNRHFSGYLLQLKKKERERERVWSLNSTELDGIVNTLGFQLKQK